MTEETFADLGRVEAISRLYEGTPYKPFRSGWFETSGKAYVTTHARTYIEGIDFDLTYFPLKHLGYKCVVGTTGELYAEFSHPQTMEIRLGISSKLDFKHIKDIWEGIVAAAKEHGYKQVGLDLTPSPNGLFVSVSVTGETSLLWERDAPQPKAWTLSAFPTISEQHSWDSRCWKGKREHSKRAEMQRHSLSWTTTRTSWEHISSPRSTLRQSN